MKLFSAVLAFFLAAAAAGANGGPALRFARVPLGNVALVLSARFQVPVTITTNARAPITGDFSGLDLAAALAAAAAQAGLIARRLAPDAGGGYILEPPPSGEPTAQEVAQGLQAAARRRAELLRQRAALLQPEAAP
jgi:hypothetical protein